MIATDNCPLSTVENKEFRMLMKTMASFYKVPKSITKEIELKYHEIKKMRFGKILPLLTR